MSSEIEVVKRIVSEALLVDAASISETAPLLELPNIDSLSFEMIIAGLEEASGKSIAASDLLTLQTVGDLTTFLKK